ncbi:MAG: hemerythrin domain-containing protein [Pirellulales bacterium]
MKPDAECRSYIEHLHAEHRRIQRMIGDVQQAIAAWAEAGSPHGRLDELAARLADLQSELQHHFIEEEAGGCLEESLSHNPSLSDDVKAALLEHPTLLQSLAEIADRLQDPASAKAPREVQAMFDALATRLRMHEAAEERVLRRGFGAAATE